MFIYSRADGGATCVVWPNLTCLSRSEQGRVQYLRESSVKTGSSHHSGLGSFVLSHQCARSHVRSYTVYSGSGLFKESQELLVPHSPSLSSSTRFISTAPTRHQGSGPFQTQEYPCHMNSQAAEARSTNVTCTGPEKAISQH